MSSTTAGLAETTDLLSALEQSAAEGGIVLQGEGIRLNDDGAGTTLALQFERDQYEDRDGVGESLSREDLLDLAAAGDVFVTITPLRAASGNLIASGGTFDGKGAWNAGTTNASVTWNGEADFTIDEPSAQRWRVQFVHAIAIEANVEYSICYSAKAEGSRYIQVNVDTGASDYRGLMGTAFTPEVGAATRGTGTSLTEEYHEFRHRFVSPEADSTARLVFDLAQSDVDLQIDNVGLYRGRGCGNPSPPGARRCRATMSANARPLPPDVAQRLRTSL